MHVKKTISYILALAFVAAGCANYATPIQINQLSTQNPTSYSFSFPLEQARSKAWEAFSIEHQVSNPIFGRSAFTNHFESIFSAECATNAIFGKLLFDDPANAQDIYLHTFHTPFAKSSVYHDENGGLPFIATFHLHFAANGPNTMVSVTASNCEVVAGAEYGIGPCGPGLGNKYKPVKPTSVEEYSILCYIGNYLGVTNMPTIIVPKS